MLMNIPMKDMEFIKTKTIGASGQIASILLNRVEKANAYHTPMMVELQTTLEAIAASQTVRAVILVGSGSRSFCAGADLNELGTRNHLDAMRLLSRSVFDSLARLPMPTIAAINGAAFAGGLELALACDLRLCVSQARFSLPETKLGLIPAAGGVQRLADVIGTPRAKQLILFGQEIDADCARAWGLVSHVTDDLEAEALKWAELASQKDPLANRLAKLNMASHYDGRLEAVSQALLYNQRKG